MLVSALGIERVSNAAAVSRAPMPAAFAASIWISVVASYVGGTRKGYAAAAAAPAMIHAAIAHLLSYSTFSTSSRSMFSLDFTPLNSEGI